MVSVTYVRIVSDGQRYASDTISTIDILAQAEGQLLVLITFLPTSELFSVTVVKVSIKEVIRQDIGTFVELPTCHWFRMRNPRTKCLAY